MNRSQDHLQQIEGNDKNEIREFPDGLVVRIRPFHCCSPVSSPGQGTEVLQAVWRGKKKKLERSQGSLSMSPA